MEALRDLADDFNVRDPRKLYRLARQRDLDVTQAMAFEARRGPAGAGAPAARAGQVGRRGAERPAAGRPHRLQPEHAGEDEVRPGGDGRLQPGVVVEPLQNKNAETVGRATKRAARELTGDDGNFVVTTDLGNEFATLDRELPEAVRRTKRPEDRNAIAVVDRGIQTLKGGQWRAAGAYNARPHETVHSAPEDVEKQPATEFRALQDNADKFQHNKDLTDRRVQDVGAFRAPTNAARSFNPQYGDVQQLGAVDSMTVRSTEGRETLLKLALPAPGSGNAAGRLTRRRLAAVRQLPRLAFENDFFRHSPAQKNLEKRVLRHCAGWGGIPGA